MKYKNRNPNNLIIVFIKLKSKTTTIYNVLLKRVFKIKIYSKLELSAPDLLLESKNILKINFILNFYKLFNKKLVIKYKKE